MSSPLAYRFEVAGVVTPWARPRVQLETGRFYNAKRMTAFERAVAWSCRAAMPGPLEGGIEVVIEVRIAPPKSWSNERRRRSLLGELEPTSRPDLDNYLKAVLDALNGVAYGDDAQVVEATIRKVFRPVPSLAVIVRQKEAPQAGKAGLQSSSDETHMKHIGESAE